MKRHALWSIRIVAKWWRDLPDLIILKSWEQKENCLTNEQRQQSFEQEAVWLQLLPCVTRLIWCVATEAARTTRPVTVAAPVSGAKTEGGTTGDNLGPGSN